MKSPSISTWNREQVGHLYRRAGFGATPAELDVALDVSPHEAVAHLVHYEALPATSPEPEWLTDESSRRLGGGFMKGLSADEKMRLRQGARQQADSLRMWWLTRMIRTTRPLEEKLTLFWHGHFATSIEKVKSPYAMYQQNQTFRRLASGGWNELVTAVAQDPAMLVYLDNVQSRPKAPNENFARELMELFTLGEGHYTEEDIKAAALAFVGWGMEADRFAFLDRKRMHNHDNKTFMGKVGDLDGHDIIRIILARDQAADFIVHKLWSFFAYENPEPEIVRSLSRLFREGDMQLKPLLTALFLHPAFYSARAMRTQIKSPVQWLVGTLRALDADLPPVHVTVATLRQLGQDLFAPPNVRGWIGGYAWITPATLLSRNNFIHHLLGAGNAKTRTGEGRMMPARFQHRPSIETLVPSELQGKPAQVCQTLRWRLYQSDLPGSKSDELHRMAELLPPADRWTGDDLIPILLSMMSSPQYQLT